MNNFIIILMTTLVLTNCNSKHDNTVKNPERQEEGNFILEGILNGGEGKILFLQEYTPDAFITIDTIFIDNNNYFRYEHPANFPAFYALKNDMGEYIILLPSEYENIKITGQYNFTTYTLKNSRDSEIISDLQKKTRQFLNTVAEISALTRDSLNSPHYSEIKLNLTIKYDSIFNDLRNYSISLIEEHITSPLVLIALFNKTGPGTYVLDPVRDIEIFNRVDSILYYLYPDFFLVKSLHDKLNLLKIKMSAQYDSKPELNMTHNE